MKFLRTGTSACVSGWGVAWRMSTVFHLLRMEKNGPERAAAALCILATSLWIALSHSWDAFRSFSLKVLVPFVHSSARGFRPTPRGCFLFIA